MLSTNIVIVGYLDVALLENTVMLLMIVSHCVLQECVLKLAHRHKTVPPPPTLTLPTFAS